MSTLERSVRSSTYNFVASGAQTVIQFFRSIILARLLSPDDFGVYTFVVSFVVITKSLPLFGLGGALLHRAEESEGELAYRVHFTLTTIFTILWGIIITIIGYRYVSPDYFMIFIVILSTQLIDNITQTGKLILARSILFQRIAIVNTLITLFSTISSIFLALFGFGVWSLVSTDIVASIIALLGFYIIRPVWLPKLGWNREVIEYFLNFGSKTFIASILREALDNIDDLWTGTYLGKTSLGFYSRAYTFATYPRRILANPLSNVAASTYAELKYQKKRLSQAFFRVNAFLIRTGFFFAGILALIAPEFIRIVIGIKWLPMLTAFRLMIVYTLLDPIVGTISHIFTAVGKPEIVAKIRVIQLLVLSIGLFILGNAFDIAGVALAVNIMVILGIVVLLYQARKYVDFSIRSMFLVPTFALILGMGFGRLALSILSVSGSPWKTGSVKLIVFTTFYLSILIVLERDQIPKLLVLFKNILLKKHSME